MNRKKYVGMDVHKAAISVGVRDAIETKAATILEFIHGLVGGLSVTFEEGTGPVGCMTSSSRMSAK